MMKRLFETSVGRVEIELDRESDLVSVWRFDADGRTVVETGDEWDNVELADLLASEAGVPLEEARPIAEEFVREWVERGGEPPREPADGGTLVLVGCLVTVLGTMGVGAWTILRAIFGRLL